MDKFSILINLIQQYGPIGGSVLFTICVNGWLYFIHPWIKKRNGSYVSYHTMNWKIGTIEIEHKNQDARLKKIEDEIEKHNADLLERQRTDEARDLQLQRLENDNSEMKYMMRDFTMTQKTTNRLLGENKDLLGENKDLMSELLKKLRGEPQ